MESQVQQLSDWDNLKVSLLLCYEGKVPAIGHGMRNTRSATAWLVEEGRAKVTDDTGLQITANPGQWLMVRPGLRRQEFAPVTRLLSINFQATFLTGEILFHNGLSRVLEGAAYPALERKARTLWKTAKRNLDPADKSARLNGRTPMNLKAFLSLQRVLMDWVQTWSECLVDAGVQPAHVAARDPRVTEALEFMQQHVIDGILDGESVAAHVGLGLSQLNRLFISERGETVRQSHQRQRIEHAQNLLMGTGLSVKEVAAEMGFRQHSHFTTWFRKEMHISPTEFRGNAATSRHFPHVWKHPD